MNGPLLAQYFAAAVTLAMIIIMAFTIATEQAEQMDCCEFHYGEPCDVLSSSPIETKVKNITPGLPIGALIVLDIVLAIIIYVGFFLSSPIIETKVKNITPGLPGDPQEIPDPSSHENGQNEEK